MPKPNFSTMSSNTAWVILLVSAVFESVWAVALGKSDGLSSVLPTVVFFVALAISMVGLSIAMNEISIGTAYAVWTGIGAVLTVTFSVITGDESVSWLKILFLIGVVGCTVGLKFIGHDDEPTHDALSADGPSANGPSDRAANEPN